MANLPKAMNQNAVSLDIWPDDSAAVKIFGAEGPLRLCIRSDCIRIEMSMS